jgi:hypothetical protein
VPVKGIPLLPLKVLRPHSDNSKALAEMAKRSYKINLNQPGLFQQSILLRLALALTLMLLLGGCGANNITSTTPTAVAYPSFDSSRPEASASLTPPPLGLAEAKLKATGFNAENAKALLDELTSLAPSRVVASDGEHKALSWLESQYKAYGYIQIERQKFPTYLEGIFGQNLIATRPATTPQAPILIFGAHFDTVAGTVGANDNGSGTVITLELSRLLSNKLPGYELRFVNFSGEEIGLRGSSFYVSQLTDLERKRLVAYLNLDNIGVGNQLFAAGDAQLVALAVEVANRNGLRLVPLDLISKSKGSDHQAFVSAGLKGLGLGRWLDPQLHLPGDTPDRVYPQALLIGGGVAILVTEALTGQALT